MINNIKNELKQFGVTGLVGLKTKEWYYKSKLRKLGVEYTTGKAELETTLGHSIHKDSRNNECTSYFIINKGIGVTGIKNAEISLLDIGCGNGKVLTYGMYKKFRQVTGIDLDENGLKIAEVNCAKMQQQGFDTSYKLYFSDICVFTIPDGTNVIYIANPFGEKTLQLTLENILGFRDTQREDIYVVYAVAVHRDIFENNQQCEKIYENFNGTKTHPELSVFRIHHSKKH